MLCTIILHCEHNIGTYANCKILDSYRLWGATCTYIHTYLGYIDIIFRYYSAYRFLCLIRSVSAMIIRFGCTYMYIYYNET